MRAVNTIAEPEHLLLGSSLPPGDAHGVSVHLPKWADTVGWASREPRVLDAMKAGYPRFFVPRVADQLAMRLLVRQQSGAAAADGLGLDGVGDAGGKLAMLLDSVRHAQACRRALPEWNPRQTQPADSTCVGVYIVTWDGEITAVEEDIPVQPEPTRDIGQEDIILVTYPAELALEAKAFWQHTGFGISSRRATHWLENAPFLKLAAPKPLPSSIETSHTVDQARAALKQRIAIGQSSPATNLHVTPSDVLLFPTGMTAIAETADAIKSLRRATPDSPYRVAVFGFLYVDTYKLLHRVLGYTPTLYKYTPASIDALEASLLSTPNSPNEPPMIDALFTEFPGNPLLQSPDLARLHALSRKYNFLLVVDDTVGTYASLSLLGECDVICTSLTKMFSGECNVMGGAVTLNPLSPYHGKLKGVLGGTPKKEEAERAWFWGDVLAMERNSRDFRGRVDRASGNAEVVVGMLRGSGVVREVYYPLGGPTQEGYDKYRVEGGRYGFLVSVRFREPARAVAFYDGLDVAKGPSLGTDFTLCCAYTLLAHYKELEWAAEYGVVEDLVRISVGLEERGWLEERVARALRAAEV
ncbi:putative cystathionine gamma-synthase/beta-lyase [Parachaetomium inaequale]|uniref:Cystathionine gamma-synthase/beta-lyase n=1 Tax=Parachaetomium inaequale TaxID=2588326 RepID=A0AAN6PEN4_9PEZI|nr:putative cystathionine gamma-synthase/beta-lyase [Parachaetomium inaequale]